MFNRVYCLGLAALLLVGGCSSDGDVRRQEYLDANYYERLELPPDLTTSDSFRQLGSPEPTAEAMKWFQDDSADVNKFGSNRVPVPVGIKVKGARLQSEEGVLRLEVDESAEILWTQLSEFWSHEGIEIIRQEKILGFMETDWSSQLHRQKDAGFFKTFFSKLDPEKLDKFRMRVEPQDASKTYIYISHLGREKVSEGDVSNWRARGSVKELEREMLTRLALYVGADEKESAAILASYRPFSPRVRVPQQSINTFFLTDAVDSAWSRTLYAIDRSGADVLEKNKKTHQVKIVVGKITDERSASENDELSESSWLMQWLSSAPSEDYKNDADRQFYIKLTPQGALVRVEILTLNNEGAYGALVEQLRKSLVMDLR